MIRRRAAGINTKIGNHRRRPPTGSQAGEPNEISTGELDLRFSSARHCANHSFIVSSKRLTCSSLPLTLFQVSRQLFNQRSLALQIIGHKRELAHSSAQWAESDEDLHCTARADGGEPRRSLSNCAEPLLAYPMAGS